MRPEPPCGELAAPAELSADRSVVVDPGTSPGRSDEIYYLY
jgi:hypothetical protein